MARAGKTAQEFIKDSFSPVVAVLCSPKVENVVAKNNLTFTELLQPFTTMESEGQLKEPSGSTCIIKNWKLIVRDVNWKPLQPTEARRQLNNAVLHNYNDKTVSVVFDGRKFEIPQSAYWFDAWRETYLEVQFPSDHEFTKHFLSCIIVGVAHDDNVIDSFNTLNQQYAHLQNVTPPKLPKWFNNGVLKTYLLLHDASVISREKAEVTFETLKQNFGASNCFILTINSKSASDPILTDYWIPYIKRTDTLNTDMTSSFTQPTTPAEPQAVVSTNINVVEEILGISTSVQADTSHPLTSPDNDFYDNANSLQTHSFSGSAESVSVASKGLEMSLETHGTSLNMIDIDDIKKFLQDYALKTLLPYMEKQISQLSEVVSNRKGVSRSLLSATKRWFGTGKTGSTTANNTVIYTSDCPELQLRRLGDLWFMCGQWQRAFDAYHTAKREFYADSAWLFYAGALEMAAISAFMAGDANRKTHGYMEESIVTYLNTCRMVQYAVRATLLSVLCLSSAGLHGEAAKQLIRMTSEDSDLRSAMLLEQASLCFLSGPGSKAMCRKYAFHMVLAGHRFSKAGQKKHAYRCYKQAYQVYGDSGWRLATDHVQFALGRLASALRSGREALQWLAAPLHAAPAPTSQHTHQQAAFLREYMVAHQQWIENSEEFKDRQSLPVLPLPLVEQRGTSVLCVGPAPLSSPGRRAATSLSLADPPEGTCPGDSKMWHRMEEMLLQVAQGSVPMIFKPTVDLYNDGTDCDPVVPKGEPIQISIILSNPLKLSLVLKEVELLWQFTSIPTEESAEEVLNNEPAVASGSVVESNAICGQKIKSTLIEGESQKVLTFTLTPLRVGRLSIHGLAYKLVNVGEGGSENGNGVTISGKLDLLSGVKSTDRRLQITVIPEAPCLQMTFSETHPDIISGEMRTIDVEFTNVGPVEMKNLHLAVSHPDCISLVTSDEDEHFKLLYDEKYRDQPSDIDERTARTLAWRALASRHVAAAGGASGMARRHTLRLRAHSAAPAPRLLAYYETGLRERPYRLLRHVFNFNVAEAVEVTVTPRRNLSKSNEGALENMSLAVEVKNIYNDKNDLTVELLEASLFSRQWELTSLIATGGKSDPLLQRERFHLVLKAKRILQELPEEKVHHSRLKITDIDYTNLTANTPPYSKFILDTTPSFHETNDTLLSQFYKERKQTKLIESMFVLRWKVNDKSNGGVAVGQKCLWLDCFSKALSRDVSRTPSDNTTLQIDEYDNKPDYAEPNKKPKKDNVVMFGLEHSNHINHNFNERKICLIPITLNIVNCYGVPVKVFIDMTKQKNRECSGDLGWAGALSGSDADGREVGVKVNLGRFELRRVQLRGLCSAPGTYLVGAAFSVTTHAGDANLDLTRLSDNSSLLIVQQA